MNKQKVYIESSVISYFTSKPSKSLIVAGHQKVTYDWWHKSKSKFDCYVSQFVIDEISKGDKVEAAKRLNAVKNIPLITLTEDIEDLSLTYIKLVNIPEDSRTDGFHLAVAVRFEIDYLLSWNCKHIANGIVNNKIRKYNEKNSLFIPVLCTPLELMEA